MSCNGCRVLRRGCSQSCVLRPCLEWIESPQAQGNATLFVSKFFGRSDLLNFITAVPENNRPALFKSLLFEACGRTVNPVNGAVGLLSTGNWHLCQSAVQTVLEGGVLRPTTIGNFGGDLFAPNSGGMNFPISKNPTNEASDSEQSELLLGLGNIEERLRSGEPRLLNLFV